MIEVVGIDPSFTACGLSDGTRHEIISTKPMENEDALFALRRRSKEIVDGILRFVGEGSYGVSPQFFVEAPMLRAAGHGGSHLYDLGWLMNDLVRGIEYEYGSVPVLVPTLTVKKFASGKGNTKKDEMKLAVFKRWAVEFDRDPGCDRLHAFVLHKYGTAVIAGDVEPVTIRRRGKGQGKAA